MIERYFVPGVRLKWAFPGDQSAGQIDGSIVANPPRPITAMIYDGLDGELRNATLPPSGPPGMSKGMRIPYGWLPYAAGQTATTMLATDDILTGYMHGGLVALWQESGRRYVGHLGTAGVAPDIAERVRTTFAGAMQPDATGFDPAAAWDPGEIFPKQMRLTSGAEMKILGLVTTAGQFHSVLLFKLTGRIDEWCVGGCKIVPPLGRDALYLQLRTSPDP